jgi:hypothetical protein
MVAFCRRQHSADNRKRGKIIMKKNVEHENQRYARKTIKDVAANSCCKFNTWVSTGLNQEMCPSTPPTKLVVDRNREAYKYVLYPRQFTLRLFTWFCNVERLVSDALDKFSLLIEYWNLYRTDIYSIHCGPANQTVPVRDVIPSSFTVPFTPVNQIY